MREESLPSDVAALREIVADCEAADRDLRARLADIRAMRQVGRQAGDPRHQSPEARAHLARELERLRASLGRPGVVSPTIRAHLSIPAAGSFPDPAEFFRLMLRRVGELHAAASRRLLAASIPREGKGRKTRPLSRIQKALVILQYRAKTPRESIRVADIARDAGCSVQNLYDSPEFQKALEIARNRRIRRGWKINGVADAVDDST